MKPCKAWNTERCGASKEKKLCEHSRLHIKNDLCDRGNEYTLCPVCEIYSKDMFKEDEFNVS